MRRAALLALALAAASCGGGFELAVGDCLVVGDEVDEAGMGEVTRVDCDEPHDLEVFHLFDLAPDETSGDARIERVAEVCLGEAFTSYVGVPADRSPLRLFPLPPSPDEVARGDREVACAVEDRDGPTRGSVRAGGTA